MVAGAGVNMNNRALIIKGADVNTIDIHGNIALISSGADVNIIDIHGNIALIS